MTTSPIELRVNEPHDPPFPAGTWLVDPMRSTALFTAQLAGRRVQGRLPLYGGAVVAESVADSTAHLEARTEALSTGSARLDRLLTGPGFLDAEAFPRLSFRSQFLMCVPTGWRAVGVLDVKGAEHSMACELDADVRQPHPRVAAITLTSRWILDAQWITPHRIPTLSRCVVMRCTVVLAHCEEPSEDEIQRAA